ncbi:PA0069 family radical SAM protein [Echinicola jeungdonensis]|uniref:PA0069 family radical SAM protein n=1 Tax=Echinicola jeungdonensis TaxID=709343 RepID=A0ABV5J5D4_9BACT|nr:PA0069 family radical SAM protein [Echinicola jeungdonensis]MDN3670835.1 PA0069 family radical SAM protein [Echinicola jeungdonensis]
MKEDKYKGRGAHSHPHNPYIKRKIVVEHDEGVDEEKYLDRPVTKYFSEMAKQGISKNNSPDLPLDYSVNPYQGCEHGCVYCYARNSHQYWGFDAGLGFETNIMVKYNIVEALEKQFSQKNYQPKPIMLSGNTDCYQPAEKKYQLTRKILELCLKVKHPVSIITKNTLIARDSGIIEELARNNLVHVYMSINHLDQKLKLKLEPRTALPQKKIDLIGEFTQKGIPCGVMVAPIIPSLNSEDIPKIIEKTANAGALKAGYTIVRLNGTVKEVFSQWIWENFPDRAQKVLHQIEEVHGGQLNDTDWGRRIKGEGPIAQMINRVFQLSVKKFMNGRKMPPFNLQAFCPDGQTRLF